MPADSPAPVFPFVPRTKATKAAADFNDPNSAERLELLCAANHPATPVEWLWSNRIPVGKVTLIAGDSGLGKSLVALDVAARVTRGSAWPEEGAGSREQGAGKSNAEAPSPSSDSLLPAPCSLPQAPGSVLILSASDDLTDTIRPRLDACGADPSRVFVLPSITDLRHDFGQLKAAVDRVPNCRLIIVDPVNAFVGPSDSHFHTVVRRVLTPLTRLAAEKRIAVLAVTQFRKNDGAAIHRAAGSTGFVATARSLWTVCRDPRDPGRNLLLPIKQNLTATACGLAYRIAQTPGSFAPHIAWEPDTETPTPEEAFARPKQPAAPAPERLAARQWLQSALAAGPRPASDVIYDGERRGFLQRTLQRAFHELEGSTEKRGLLQGWWWSLSPNPIVPDLPPQETPDIFEDVTYEQDVRQRAELDALFDETLFAALDPNRPQSSSPTGNPDVNPVPDSFRATSPAKPAPAKSPPPNHTPDSRSKLSPNAAPLADQVQCARLSRVAGDARNAPDSLPRSRVRRMKSILTRSIFFVVILASAVRLHSLRADEPAPAPIFAKALAPGDTIMFIAPAAYLDEPRNQLAKKRLEERGLQVVFPKTLFRKHGYFAGPDEARAAEIMAAFNDPQVDAIFPGTGGYGTTRIVDDLDYNAIRRHPKIFIGFSDITALHLAINQQTGLVTFHTPNPEWGLGSPKGFNPYTARWFWQALTADKYGRQAGYTIIPQPTPDEIAWDKKVFAGFPTVRTITPGKARGRLIGGNLSVVHALMGTPYEIQTNGKILFLEDVGEAPYRVDRMLSTMKLAGKFDHVAGILLGSFTRREDEQPWDDDWSMDDVLRDYFTKLGVPVLANFPVGHVPFNTTLPIGAEAELDATQGTIRILENPVQLPVPSTAKETPLMLANGR